MHKLISAVLSLIFLVSMSVRAETVTFAIGDWEPFTSAKDPKSKLTEKVVIEALKLEGLDASFAYFPWKRASTLLEEGGFDGSFPWGLTDDRAKLFHYTTTTVLKDESVYFHLKTTKFDWNTIQDLKKYKVGVTIGFSNEKLYKDLGIPADAVVLEDLNFKKMLVGRLDVYDTSKSVGLALIAKLFTPEEAKLFTYHSKIISNHEYYGIFSKVSPKGKLYADKLESGLKKLKASGAYDKIMSQL